MAVVVVRGMHRSRNRSSSGSCSRSSEERRPESRLRQAEFEIAAWGRNLSHTLAKIRNSSDRSRRRFDSRLHKKPSKSLNQV